MLGSSCAALVHAAGSSGAIGASAIGYSPPSWSDCVLDRYGQNATESESDTPGGQAGLGTGLPVTGFAGVGGHTHAVLAEERPGRERQRRRDGVRAARGLAVAVDDRRPAGVRIVVVLARVAAGDLVARQDRPDRDARRLQLGRPRRRVGARPGVDEDADRGVALDPGVVDPDRPPWH